jgi:hypothetical protein
VRTGAGGIIGSIFSSRRRIGAVRRATGGPAVVVSAIAETTMDTSNDPRESEAVNAAADADGAAGEELNEAAAPDAGDETAAVPSAEEDAATPDDPDTADEAVEGSVPSGEDVDAAFDQTTADLSGDEADADSADTDEWESRPEPDVVDDPAGNASDGGDSTEDETPSDDAAVEPANVDTTGPDADADEAVMAADDPADESKSADASDEESPAPVNENDGDDDAAEAELQATIDLAISLLDEGNYEAFIDRFVHPDDRETMPEQADLMATFAEAKADTLAEALREARGSKAELAAGRATFQVGQRPLVFERHEDTWYLRN